MMLHNDIVTYLVRVVEKVMGELSGVLKQETKQKIVIPILKTVLSLCVTTEFNWHLTKQNALDLLNNMRETEDEKIREIAREVCEKVVEHIDDSLFQETDFKSMIRNLLNDHPSKQLSTLN